MNAAPVAIALLKGKLLVPVPKRLAAARAAHELDRVRALCRRKAFPRQGQRGALTWPPWQGAATRRTPPSKCRRSAGRWGRSRVSHPPAAETAWRRTARCCSGGATVCRHRGGCACRARGGLSPRLDRLFFFLHEFGQQLIDARVRCRLPVLAGALTLLPPPRR